MKISFLLLGTVLATQSQSLEVSMSFHLESMPQQRLPAPAYVLGVRVDRLSQQQTLDMIEQIIVSRRASGNTLPCQQIITVNTEFVMAAQQNAEFRHTINTAALVIADSWDLCWIANSCRRRRNSGAHSRGKCRCTLCSLWRTRAGPMDTPQSLALIRSGSNRCRWSI